MGSWVVWIVVAVAFTAGEIHTNGLYLAPFAVGAAFAALLAGVGAGGLIATIGFVLAAILVLLALRPIALRHRKTPLAIRTGTAALIGQDGLVVERISNREGMGTVKIGGEVWTARAYEADQQIEAGEQVQVVEIKGATALVMR